MHPGVQNVSSITLVEHYKTSPSTPYTTPANAQYLNKRIKPLLAFEVSTPTIRMGSLYLDISAITALLTYRAFHHHALRNLINNQIFWILARHLKFASPEKGLYLQHTILSLSMCSSFRLNISKLFWQLPTTY